MRNHSIDPRGQSWQASLGYWSYRNNSIHKLGNILMYQLRGSLFEDRKSRGGEKGRREEEEKENRTIKYPQPHKPFAQAEYVDCSN